MNKELIPTHLLHLVVLENSNNPEVNLPYGYKCYNTVETLYHPEGAKAQTQFTCILKEAYDLVHNTNTNSKSRLEFIKKYANAKDTLYDIVDATLGAILDDIIYGYRLTRDELYCTCGYITEFDQWYKSVYEDDYHVVEDITELFLNKLANISELYDKYQDTTLTIGNIPITHAFHRLDEIYAMVIVGDEPWKLPEYEYDDLTPEVQEIFNKTLTNGVIYNMLFVYYVNKNMPEVGPKMYLGYVGDDCLDVGHPPLRLIEVVRR